ncbi:MAG: YfiR family protein [Rhizomicrobium sp.]|nr:YfiR family protein [Rhizomicrobium sp.]
MRPRSLLVAAVAGGLFALPLRADPAIEYAVKAAYLTKFIPFITWPNTASFSICVLGDDPFAGKLEQAASGTKLADHPIQVRHIAAPDASCQILFLSDPSSSDAALEALRGKPVLTVTDSGLKEHGVISFVIADNHVRFDIDDAAAAQDGIAISSKLLGLAHSVKQRGQP